MGLLPAKIYPTPGVRSTRQDSFSTIMSLSERSTTLAQYAIDSGRVSSAIHGCVWSPDHTAESPSFTRKGSIGNSGSVWVAIWAVFNLHSGRQPIMHLEQWTSPSATADEVEMRIEYGQARGWATQISSLTLGESHPCQVSGSTTTVLSHFFK